MNIPPVNLPADLPADWTNGQIVSPSGTDVGLSQQHGYNYLNNAVNAAQTAIKAIRDFFAGSGMVGTNDIANGAITTEKLVDKAVTWEKISDTARAIHKNLLGNWYFADPINQRGKSVYTVVGYTIDRWKIWAVNNPANNQSIQVADGGIVLDASGTGSAAIVFEQYFEKPINGTYTVSVLVDEISGQLFVETASLVITQPGLLTATFTVTAAESLRMYNLGTGIHCKIRAIKLELGDTQTLAHQDASGNWVLNDPPPDKALELAKCQSYFLRLAGDGKAVLLRKNVRNSSSLTLGIPTPVTMRVNPVVRVDAELFGEEEDNHVSGTFTGVLCGNGVRVNCTAMNVAASSDTELSWFLSSDSYIELDADL